jgi:hypothetical protein
MSSASLGRVEEVGLRKIWPNEAYDFTPWLAEEENLSLLGEMLGLSLVDPDMEVGVGAYSSDIRCKTSPDNRIVVIENQIERSDHDHLGKAIVYASGLDASIIIWIVKEARPEHGSAIEWLNEHSDSDIGFFLIEIHAIKIGDSQPAPQFKIIQQPNDYMKATKANADKELTRSQLGRYEFWSQLNDYIQSSSYKLRIRKPGYDHWYDFRMGSSKYHLSVCLLDRTSQIRVLLWIPDNKEIYDKLFAHKNEIDSLLDFKLDWERKDDSKASSINSYISGFSFNNSSNHAELHEEICRRLTLMEKVLKQFLR